MKKQVLMSFLILLPSAFLSACGDDAKSVEWWQEHDAERAQKVTECKDDSSDMASADCLNALEAQRKEELGGDNEMKSPSIR